MNPPSEFCGSAVGLVTTSGAAAATVCSTRTPFHVAFMSDHFETVGENVAMKGFQLGYFQDATNCS